MGRLLERNNKMDIKGFAIASALAAMMTPAVAQAHKASAHSKMMCTGSNDCKGHGSCKGASNECKGKNACKGQGFTMEKSAKSCKKKGGTLASAATMDMK
jgi:hypothetical protein